MTPRVRDAERRCRVTVVGGFLGAGKTTFLNGLLARAQGRYAVLVNDFGAVNVDAGLVAGHDGETVRLTNGCVCCSLSDGFLATLMRVLDQQPPFEAIVIEASGVGDPAAIGEIALVEPGLVLGAVVVLAAADRIATLINDPRVGDTVQRQLRGADVVLLNKADLASSTELAAARAALTSVEPGLGIVETVYGRVPADVLDAQSLRLPGRFRAEAVSHEVLFQRLHYRRKGRFEPSRLSAALDRAWPSLLRLKGQCMLTNSDEPQLLQMVGPRWTLTSAPECLKTSSAIGLVGIGTGPEISELEAILDAALDRPALAGPGGQGPGRR